MAAAIALASCGPRPGKDAASAQNDSTATATMEKTIIAEPEFDIITSKGTMRIRLYGMTPKHRDNFVKLVNEKYYDGVRFHRVIEGFMIRQETRSHATQQRSTSGVREDRTTPSLQNS